ncbi:hypothetical protein [Pseudomonas mohnii]
MATDLSDLIMFSCDSPRDAIKTLSLINGVDAKEIEKVCLGDWPEFLKKDFNSFDSEYFPWLMADHVNGRLNCEFQEATYYHRARYDGTDAWFDNGLLSSAEGAVEFLHKTRSLYVGYDFERILTICEENIADSTTLGHSAHDHLDTRSTLTWTPDPHPLGQAVGAQRRRFALLV